MQADSDPIAAHLQETLGPIVRVWGDASPQVAEFAPGRIDDAVIYATLGLSRQPLRHPYDDGHVHREFLVIAPEDRRGDDLPQLLLAIAHDVVRYGEAPDLGAVLRNLEPLRALSAMDALTVLRPLPFSPQFASAIIDGRHTEVQWLMPVTSTEVAQLSEHDWQAFEQYLYDRTDLDPIDFDRS